MCAATGLFVNLTDLFLSVACITPALLGLASLFTFHLVQAQSGLLAIEQPCVCDSFTSTPCSIILSVFPASSLGGIDWFREGVHRNEVDPSGQEQTLVELKSFVLEAVPGLPGSHEATLTLYSSKAFSVDGASLVNHDHANVCDNTICFD